MLQIGTNVRINNDQGEFAGCIGTITEIASGQHQVHFRNEREYRVRFRSRREYWFREEELEALPGKETTL